MTDENESVCGILHGDGDGEGVLAGSKTRALLRWARSCVCEGGAPGDSPVGNFRAVFAGPLVGG